MNTTIDNHHGSKAKSSSPSRSAVFVSTPNAVLNVLGSANVVARDDIPDSLLASLPGEIRNVIYEYTLINKRQALLVHRPRLSSLRPRTRFDRARPLGSSNTAREYDRSLLSSDVIQVATVREDNAAVVSRMTNRPFHSLTQVSRQFRLEYLPLYLRAQETGLDLVDVISYLRTFYPDAPQRFAQLVPADAAGHRVVDLPFLANLTIAVGEKPTAVEIAPEGMDVLLLLDLWANSYKFEAGFGRYARIGYSAMADGEAKDLYRLFGRRVMPTRKCSGMNLLWRMTLRTRSLASVRIHRRPPLRALGKDITPSRLDASAVATVLSGTIRDTPTLVKPYIHLVFKKATAEPWMTRFQSDVPKGWLADRGFGGMEYFDVRVGAV